MSEELSGKFSPEICLFRHPGRENIFPCGARCHRHASVGRGNCVQTEPIGSYYYTRNEHESGFDERGMS